MRILQLSTHTTLIPNHGGKLRSHHIARVLEQQGFAVRRLAFCFRVPDDLHDPREPIIDVSRTFWESSEFASYGPCRQYLSDYIPTVEALRLPGILAEFDDRFRAAAPDVILLEHPWTWPLLVRLEEVRSGAVPVVYSSQNVETVLKRKILDEAGITPPPGVLEGIDALERSLVANAAGVSACTRADVDTFASWGARRVVMAANGGVRRRRDHLLDLLPWPIEPSHAFAFAVGSGHPPNVSGFLNLVGPSLPVLRPHQRVVVAGGAAASIVQTLQANGLERMMAGRLISLGPIDEFSLDCAIANADVLLLPVQYGGGSNVKTAEALLSGRPIVATGVAMRGFDRFRGAPGLTIADDPAGFGKSLLAALERPFQRSAADDPALATLLWESTIDPLVEMMREIEDELAASRGSAPPLERAAYHAGE